jgi:hypothetical protein
MDRKGEIRTAIDANLRMRGWAYRSVCSLPPCYCQGGIVTPYFWLGDVVRRLWGDFAVDASIGVIHQEFEKAWAQRYPGHPSEHSFAATSLIVNFSELLSTRYIPSQGDFKGAVERFCDTLVGLLEALPMTEAQLSDSWKKDALGSHPARKFMNAIQIGKFNGLKDFVKGDFQIGVGGNRA